MQVNLDSIQKIVNETVDSTPMIDIHTHLFAPHFGSLLLWGIDELLTYHYLIAEVLRVAPMPMDAYWKMSTREKADYSWEHLFVKRSPISEACRGVLTCLERLGLDPTDRDLNKIRTYYNQQKIDAFIDNVMNIANLKYMVMTNDPFDKQETPVWFDIGNSDPRFQAALRIDPLLMNWNEACKTLQEQGYEVTSSLNEMTLANIRKFLENWIDKMNPRYMAVSLPPSFTFPDGTDRTRIIESCVLPVAEER
ncbi:glucuronate isomerase, partial [bacterium]|nr:glucuronate isomerase [bacterium]